jgi:hypothetical protein
MSAVSAPALTATMLDDDAWDDLLSFIEERRVVPIVGPELRGESGAGTQHCRCRCHR